MFLVLHARNSSHGKQLRDCRKHHHLHRNWKSIQSLTISETLIITPAQNKQSPSIRWRPPLLFSPSALLHHKHSQRDQHHHPPSTSTSLRLSMSMFPPVSLSPSTKKSRTPTREKLAKTLELLALAASSRAPCNHGKRPTSLVWRNTPLLPLDTEKLSRRDRSRRKMSHTWFAGGLGTTATSLVPFERSGWNPTRSMPEEDSRRNKVQAFLGVGQASTGLELDLERKTWRRSLFQVWVRRKAIFWRRTSVVERLD